MDKFKDIWSDVKAAPYILNICRQPRTFVKLHAGISAIVGLSMVIVILILGFTMYFNKTKEMNESEKKTAKMIIISAYILFVMLIAFWIIPAVTLGLHYDLINF